MDEVKSLQHRGHLLTLAHEKNGASLLHTGAYCWGGLELSSREGGSDCLIKHPSPTMGVMEPNWEASPPWAPESCFLADWPKGFLLLFHQIISEGGLPLANAGVLFALVMGWTDLW